MEKRKSIQAIVKKPMKKRSRHPQPPPISISKKRSRPPSPSRLLSPTWRHVAKQATGTDQVLVGGALLATQAKRRRQLIRTERNALKIGSTAAFRRRVSALENEWRQYARSVEYCKLAAIRFAYWNNNNNTKKKQNVNKETVQYPCRVHIKN